MRPSSKPFLFACLVWFVIACALGMSGATLKLQPPVPQLIMLAITATLVGMGVFHAGFRAWVLQADLRGVLAFHLTRFVGLWFIVLHTRGELPMEFAMPAGAGDVAVAVAAVFLLAFFPRPERAGLLLWLWNIVGTLDIAGAVATGSRMAFAYPGSMNGLLRFPTSLVPTFIVPMVIASHVLVFVRLSRVPRTTS